MSCWQAHMKKAHYSPFPFPSWCSARLSVLVNSKELLEKFLTEITGSVTGMHSTPSKPSVTATTSVPVPQTDKDLMQWESVWSCNSACKNPQSCLTTHLRIFRRGLLKYPLWLKAFEALFEGRAVKPTVKNFSLVKLSKLLIVLCWLQELGKKMLKISNGNLFSTMATFKRNLKMSSSKQQPVCTGRS